MDVRLLQKFQSFLALHVDTYATVRASLDALQAVTCYHKPWETSNVEKVGYDVRKRVHALADELLALCGLSYYFAPYEKRSIRTAGVLIKECVGLAKRQRPPMSFCHAPGHCNDVVALLRLASSIMEGESIDCGYDESTRVLVRDKLAECVEKLEEPFEM